MRKSQTASLEYFVGGQHVKLTFNQEGEVVEFLLNNRDYSKYGDSLASVIQSLEARGLNMQEEISKAFEEAYLPIGIREFSA